ncbi:hypothetical protein [Acidisoma sp. L85]|uniref:hypothetical protein n=1 Tax=Acidisoma sp. L85 TaxID=1641850 RepID=UPI00131B8F37|nr:hypothetical protein [Acidisoma sp. L85]
MPSKTLDIDADLKALLAKAEKMKTDQKLRLGGLVLETGADKVLDADAFQDLLRWGMDQLKANPHAAEAWRRGDAGFPAKLGVSDNALPGSGRAPSVPPRNRTADLLEGNAAQ